MKPKMKIKISTNFAGIEPWWFAQVDNSAIHRGLRRPSSKYHYHQSEGGRGGQRVEVDPHFVSTPDVEVESIDLVSIGLEAVAFIVAITTVCVDLLVVLRAGQEAEPIDITNEGFEVSAISFVNTAPRRHHWSLKLQKVKATSILLTAPSSSCFRQNTFLLPALLLRMYYLISIFVHASMDILKWMSALGLTVVNNETNSLKLWW